MLHGEANMADKKIKRDVDGVTHSKPGSVDQQSEDTFPASDSPTFSPGAVGAPVNRETPHAHSGDAIPAAEQKNEKQKSWKKPIA
jgi:hypothetical protein